MLNAKPNQSPSTQMNKTALVTGGTKGIGKAICFRLLQEGWDVIITYGSDTEAAQKTYQEFSESFTNKVYLLQADISDLVNVNRIDDFLDENDLNLNAVIFNAGITDRSDFHSIQVEDWEKVFTANVHFPVFLLQKIYHRIQQKGSVVFTGSLMAIHPHSVSLSYGITKASVHALVKNLVKFFTDKQIRVNAVVPGFVETDWHKSKPAAVRQNIYDKLAAGRFCTPEELTDVYMLLLNNTYINGETVVCDGGYSYK
jgi:3-oxoacyl-[acyl-carrier protein] reductase